MQEETKANLSDRNIWARGLYMLFYLIAYAVAETVLTLVVLFQFISTLVTGKVNEAAQTFGANLAMYVYQILQYVTFNSENHVFPFADWPEETAGATPWNTADTETQPETVVEPAETVVEPTEIADERDPNKPDQW